MTRQLVFVHGRSQQGKEAGALKAEWIASFKEGLARNGLQLPLAESDIRFPYYGDTLDEMVKGRSAADAVDVIVRGTESDEAEQRFMREVLAEVRKKERITDRKLDAVLDREVVERGPLNWEWLQGVLRAVDRYVPFGSGSAVALATNDVYHYLTNTAIRNEIDSGVASAIRGDRETVVVAHSLGTVVAYNALRQRGADAHWQVPLFVTLGSPLGVKVIRDKVTALKQPRQCPPCARTWFNAMDERDVVALYPLTTRVFSLNPVDPSILNKTDVANQTENRHGISGYLNDPEVARRVHDALTAP